MPHNVPDIDEKVIKTNTNLENYCNQQNIGFISNNSIKKSDLNARGLHLHVVVSWLKNF